jgi:hypothetical protein
VAAEHVEEALDGRGSDLVELDLHAQLLQGPADLGVLGGELIDERAIGRRLPREHGEEDVLLEGEVVVDVVDERVPHLVEVAPVVGSGPRADIVEALLEGVVVGAQVRDSVGEVGNEALHRHADKSVHLGHDEGARKGCALPAQRALVLRSASMPLRATVGA